MPYVQGSSIEKVDKGSFQRQIATIHEAIEKEFGDSPVNIISTHQDHCFVSGADGKFMKVSYTFNGDTVEDIKVRPSKAIPIIEDEDVPGFVSNRLGSIVKSMANGKDVPPDHIQEVMQLINAEEDYWLSDVLGKLEESEKKQKWFAMYESNMAQIRTALHGRIKKIEEQVPRTTYSTIAKGKISNFKNELIESVGILKTLSKSLIDETSAVVFDKDNEFFSAIRKSLIAEAQAIHGLLGKAEKLMGPDDLTLMAVAHDRLAGRAKKMAIVSEYLKTQAHNDE